MRLSRNHAATHKASAARNEAFNGDGGKIEGKRTCSAINGVASRLSVVLRKGPLTRPSINGIIAAEAINEVNRKSAFRKILKTAERAAIKAEQAKAASRAMVTASAAPKFNFASSTALTKPPR